jgi:hypothetical protein
VSETSSEEHKSSKAVANSVCMSGPVSVGETSLPWLFGCHGVGRDINVQCVLIKEMIIIVDHYTLAVRNRR